MTNEKVFQMKLKKIYLFWWPKQRKRPYPVGGGSGHLLAHWVQSGRVEPLVESGITYGDFFRNAPAPNPNRKLITGSICGVKVETIEDPLMQEIRYLDKLVDELAKGKAMEKVLRK
mgnify:CR=1 FL=1